MDKVQAYIESGILERYVMGETSAEESKQVETMALQYAPVQEELLIIQATVERLAQNTAISPPATIKPFWLATVNYMQRLMQGEQPGFPPELHPQSTKDDFSVWLDRPDLSVPSASEDLYARIIGYTPAMTTAIVWIKTMAPHEVHDNEYEKFLVLEGTCEITIGENEVHRLVPGNYLAIPLHKTHTVKVTSEIPCKVIL